MKATDEGNRETKGGKGELGQPQVSPRAQLHCVLGGRTCGVVWSEAAQHSKAAVEGAGIALKHAAEHVLQQVHVYQPVRTNPRNVA